MEKIILIQNSNKPDKASLSYACYLAKLSSSKLTALLLTNEEMEFERAGDRSAGNPAIHELVVLPVEKLKQHISDECRKNKITVEVVEDENGTIENAIFESYFADLLVISAGFSVWEKETAMPSAIIRQLLTKSQCPVFLSPPVFNLPEEIIFCYDGSASSLFAIKQFAYLLPGLKEIKCTIVEVTDYITCNKIVSHTKLLSWLSAHYNKVDFHYLHGDVSRQLTGYFGQKKNALIVMGSYGRGLLSTLFKKSASDQVIQQTEHPLFITHH